MEETTSLPNKVSKRLLSLDALRGFDMLMISGAAGFLEALEGKTDSAFLNTIGKQMHHIEWNGFSFYDFIFPLFLFIAGVSLSFSLSKGIRTGTKKKVLYKKAFRRMLLLILIGIFYKNTPVTFFDPHHIRFVSVLGRIGFAAFITTLIYLNFSWRKRILWIAGILLAYYAALFLIPVPGFGAGDLSVEGNLTGWFDRHFLPGRLLNFGGIYDENGLLTQFPALCLTMIGSLAGDNLRSARSDYRKIGILILSGTILIGLGLLWNLHFPINKHLWSSSFIVLTGGIALWSLALFFWIIDVLNYKKWAFFFKVIGLNSLTIYLVYHYFNFNETARMIFSGLYDPLPEKWHVVLENLGALILVWLFLYFLYRKKWFLKI